METGLIEADGDSVEIMNAAGLEGARRGWNEEPACLLALVGTSSPGLGHRTSRIGLSPPPACLCSLLFPVSTDSALNSWSSLNVSCYFTVSLNWFFCLPDSFLPYHLQPNLAGTVSFFNTLFNTIGYFHSLLLPTDFFFF